ncbi:hypothetical protein Q3G72_015409 [Acer saccharum]|nr:hypothetical protein Q3G72_015409 [Acer saccharum]
MGAGHLPSLKYLLLLLHLSFPIICTFSRFAAAASTPSEAKLNNEEVKTLKVIGRKLNKTDWEFGVDPCSGQGNWKVMDERDGFESSVSCDCSFNHNSSCHVVSIALKGQNLSGIVPPELSKLRYLQHLDLSRNVLSGSIPPEWATMRLVELSFMGNRLTGPFPKVVTKITTLLNLSIEGNHFSGPIPPEIGKLINLQKLIISSNAFTGRLPAELAKLTNLTDMRINDNNFSGKIPEFISNWTQIHKLHIQGCSLEGPIPSSISALTSLSDLRISDLKGKEAAFPPLDHMKSMKTLILRKCLIHGEIPDYIAHMKKLKNLDLSFNNLTGEIPKTFIQLAKVEFMYLMGNNLTGPIPRWILERNKNVDISYNDFTSGATECLQGSVNLVESYSSSADKSSKVHPCLKQNFPCSASRDQYRYSLHINCGGKEFNSNNTNLGKRLFDVYIQGKLVLKDFNIGDEAGGTDPNFKPPVIKGKKNYVMIVAGMVVTAVLFLVLVLVIMRMKGWLGGKDSTDKELRGLDQQTGLYKLRQIKDATKNFDAANKVGEGGFGSVYKGILSDGTVIAVKQLSSKSRQGNREFINEIGMISALQHPNLVKLYGCCVEGNQLLLIYEYMENNCVSRALFGRDAASRIKLHWPARRKICMGIARDFGLAKLYEDDTSHISTRVAGTIGYMAPEYAMRGYLTNKADVYSFGVVALEIVSGKSNTNFRPNEDFVYLLDWAYVLQERGSLLDLVDPNLGAEYSSEEAMVMLNVALLCTNASPTLRPTMSQVVSMLEGRTVVQDLLSDPGFLAINSKVKAMRNHFWQNPSQTHSFSTDGPCTDKSNSNIKSEESDPPRPTSVRVFKKAKEVHLADLIDKYNEDMQIHGEEVINMKVAAWRLQSDFTKRPSMSMVICFGD